MSRKDLGPFRALWSDGRFKLAARVHGLQRGWGAQVPIWNQVEPNPRLRGLFLSL
ncbi:MAG: hypothetical protein ABGY29_01255 [bacterium]